MGVERFVSRRGTPAITWSDNGTNFVGAEKELRENIAKWNTINIAVELAHKGIKWRFYPPSAPHQGGIWERLVRSFKRLLYTILGTRRLTDEVLSTTFCLVEHALNSRPLPPVSADPSDLGALTPNHFLLGNKARSLPSIIGVDELITVNVSPARSHPLTLFGLVGSKNTYRRWTDVLSGKCLPSNT